MQCKLRRRLSLFENSVSAAAFKREPLQLAHAATAGLLVDEAAALPSASRNGERADPFHMAEVSDSRAVSNRMFDGHNGQEIAEFFKCERAHNLKYFML